MVHITQITAARGVAAPDDVVLAPIAADAKSDWLNSIYRQFQDTVLIKKTAGPGVPE